MLANNEIGSIQPVADVSAECRERQILFHTDAAQAVGKIDVSLNSMGNPDFVTLVGHKFGAPKGVAALYIRPGCLTENERVAPDMYGTSGALLLGGGQEKGRRAGTENVPYIVGMGVAASLVSGTKWKARAEHMNEMRSRLLHNLTKSIGADSVFVFGPEDDSKRLPNTLSLGLKHIHSGELLSNIGEKVAASAGSACHASEDKVSPVVTAMDAPCDFAKGTLRLSVGVSTSQKEVDEASELIVAEAKRLLDKHVIVC